MRMPKNEKAIIAGFKAMRQAERAQQALKRLPVLDMRIDRMSEHPLEELDTDPQNPITGDFPGLANAVYNTSMDRNSSVLVSADPSVSGISDGGGDNNIGTDVVLTVVVNEADFEQAQQIVRQYGGQF
ncbi:hypothetical protein CathTA2_2251 [Caldalkalibacillus thermarum TA2.A1]|uniref:Uncharacterized protein n=1 Tax=Caldalkalibacillus thermarum (strain TA2.A1) TaxID=986075 RepID=F5L8U6_CALTT|nr:hypothetical protein [Caldalkalibacillus thermarum]EGL82228.1 hypothetical protein CathTA2_2251 [Caldalkalibacillus thermarum TA2.A1]QZT32755.1 hypothetical protein HUR95_10210 [Caldalkalibacillus thermarum TA2.A1]